MLHSIGNDISHRIDLTNGLASTTVPVLNVTFGVEGTIAHPELRAYLYLKRQVNCSLRQSQCFPSPEGCGVSSPWARKSMMKLITIPINSGSRIYLPDTNVCLLLELSFLKFEIYSHLRTDASLAP